MAKKLTFEEEHPDRTLSHRQCSRCNWMYSPTERCCPLCVNPEFEIPLKTKVAEWLRLHPQPERQRELFE